MAPHLAPPPSHQLLPSDLPHQIRQLYAKLSQSPLIEPAFLDVRQPIAPPPGPPLPKRPVLGRRGRGRTYSGEGIDQDHGGIWNWVVTAQVKDGTENRGAVEAVVRLVRMTLLTMDSPASLPPNSKRRDHNGWAVIDAGSFAVHVLSRMARERYFENISRW